MFGREEEGELCEEDTAKPPPAKHPRKGKKKPAKRKDPPPAAAPRPAASRPEEARPEREAAGWDGTGARKPLLALTGPYQNGKSTFLNCLLGGGYAAEGDGTATTKFNARYFFGDVRGARVRHADGTSDPLESAAELFTAEDTLAKGMKGDDSFEISVYSPALQSIDILDSPGYGVKEQDNQTADLALEEADFVVCIFTKALGDDDCKFLKNLCARVKRYTAVLNCQDDRDPCDKKTAKICDTIKAALDNKKLADNYVALSADRPVYPVNLLWAQTAIGYQAREVRKKRWNKVAKGFLEGEAATPLDLLERSGFLPLRSLLENHARALSRYPASESLCTLSRLADEWGSDLIRILTGDERCQ